MRELMSTLNRGLVLYYDVEKDIYELHDAWCKKVRVFKSVDDAVTHYEWVSHIEANY